MNKLAQQAAEFFAQTPYKPSISMIERHFRPGYKAASDALDELVEAGLVSDFDADGSRRWLGATGAGYAGFADLKNKLFGGSQEAAARWWESLEQATQYRYAVKAGVRWIPFGDMEETEKRSIRAAFRKAKNMFDELGRQFSRFGGVQ